MQKLENLYISIIKWGAYLVMLTPLFVFRWVLYPHGFGKALFFQILVEIMVFFYILLVLKNKKYLPDFKNKLNIALFSFIGLLIITTFFSADPYRSFWGTQAWNNGLIVILHAFFLFLVLTNVFSKKKDWLKFLKVSVVVAFLVLLYALGQKMEFNFIFQSWAERLSATTGNPVYFSIYLLFSIMLSAFLALCYQRSSRFWLYFSSLTALVGILCFFFTNTRSGFLGLSGGLIIMIFFYFICFKGKKIRKVASALLISLIIIGSIASIYLLSSGKILTIFERSNTVKTRVISWSIAWEGFKEKPLTGWGLENFSIPFEKFFNVDFYNQGLEGKALEYAVEFPHNKILEIAVSNGIFVVIAYLALIATAFFITIKIILKTKDKKYLLILGLLTSYFIFNLFVFDSILSFILFYFLLSFIYFIHETLDQKEESTLLKEAPIKNIYLKNGVEIVVLIFVIGGIYLINIKPALASHEALLARRNLMANQDTQFLENAKSFNQKNTFINEQVNIDLAKLAVKRFVKTPPKTKEEKNVVEFMVEKMEEETKAHPNRFLSYQLLGRLYNIGGSYKPSFLNMTIPLMNELIAKGSKRIEVHHILGTAYLKKRNVTEAVKHFKKAIELNPNFHDPYVVLAKVYIFLQDINQSLKYFDKALELGYRQRDTLILFSDIYLKNENFQQARKIYNIVLEDKPDDRHTKVRLEKLDKLDKPL